MHTQSQSKTYEDRIVRYKDLKPCFDAFIDTRTPGSDQKENFTIIGPGVSENPNQFVHITEPHGFNIGGARQPPGCVNSQHSHDTVEVFFVHSGTWSFNLGEHGEDAKVTLRRGDVISIPTQLFRGFENIGQDVGYLWAILGQDDPGRVLWAPNVFEMAKEYGLVLMENGRLIDTRGGGVVPEGVLPMPITSAEQVAKMHKFSNDDLRRCCIMSDEEVSTQSNDGMTRRMLIGLKAKLNWEHGFTLDHVTLDSQAKTKTMSLNVSDIIFVHKGLLTVILNNEDKCELGEGDTMTVPREQSRQFFNNTDHKVEFLRVLGEA